MSMFTDMIVSSATFGAPMPIIPPGAPTVLIGGLPAARMILPKILCNVPLEMPVEADVELTDTEREETTVLLDTVIRYWDALRNTSLDGLRETFLVRSGKLSMREDGDWLLQVESKSYDILLGQLPWGIGVIRLPWMQRMLRVEWIH